MIKLPLVPFLMALACPLLIVAAENDGRPRSAVMPQPASIEFSDGQLAITDQFAVALTGHVDARLRSGLARALKRWEARTGFTFHHDTDGTFAVATDPAAASLVIHCGGAGYELPSVEEDESYALTVDTSRAALHSATVVGALRGLETWLQLLQSADGKWFVPAVSIHDQPRFAWRGLMIDVCRHWQPLAVIKRNLDGMALVKLNVLHLHLSEDQGFRVESKTHPELTRLGSDGNFFTQDQIREIIAYAAERGVRVVPEFDMPGHATSWAVSHPELMSAPGPYTIERKWGIFDPVFDPTNEATFALLADVVGEMADLFPDPYFHIGGDENNGRQWTANARIQSYLVDHHLKDNAGLHAYFNQRMHAILVKHGKQLVGWDEILHPDLPKDSLVHSWRGAAGLAEAASHGYATILSNGYYIDLHYSAERHYLNDPLPAGTTLTADEQARVLGGEATMWSEWVSPETIDSRIWPRTAAIAERLWSPREVNAVADMYRRLRVVSQRLEEAGLNHERNRPAMIRRVAGDQAAPSDIEALSVFIDAIEPVKDYQRGSQHATYSQFTALCGLADCTRSESDRARSFSDLVNTLVGRANKTQVSAEKIAGAKMSDPVTDALVSQLQAWQKAGAGAAAFLSTHAALGRAGAPVAQSLADVSGIGLTALEAWRDGHHRDAVWRDQQLTVLTRSAVPHDAVELPMIAAMRRLVEVASR